MNAWKRRILASALTLHLKPSHALKLGALSISTTSRGPWRQVPETRPINNVFLPTIYNSSDRLSASNRGYASVVRTVFLDPTLAPFQHSKWPKCNFAIHDKRGSRKKGPLSLLPPRQQIQLLSLITGPEQAFVPTRGAGPHSLPTGPDWAAILPSGPLTWQVGTFSRAVAI